MRNQFESTSGGVNDEKARGWRSSTNGYLRFADPSRDATVAEHSSSSVSPFVGYEPEPRIMERPLRRQATPHLFEGTGMVS